MVAEIAGFVTREDAKLRKPRSFSKNIKPDEGGVAGHYGGPEQKAAEIGADHELCISTWRAWQNYHMDTHKWVDIAYTGGYCQHGFAFAGRGAGVRTAANGTNVSNTKYYAVTFIGGKDQEPTEAALNAFEWWVDSLRAAGAGRAVKPHKSFKNTACPGKFLIDYCSKLNNSDISQPKVEEPTPQPKPESKPVKDTYLEAKVKELQALLEVERDGKWGPNTDARALTMRAACKTKAGWPYRPHIRFDIKEVQGVIDTKVDGVWGKNSQAALRSWIKTFQRTVSVSSDGIWGPDTDGKFIRTRRKYYRKY